VAIALHGPGRSTIAQTAEKAVQFFIKNGLNRAADVGAKAILDWIKPSSNASSASLLVSVIWVMA
jgi:hypothetical protein